MTISDAQPGDIYVDANWKTWRVVSVGPLIDLEAVEGEQKRLITEHDPIWTGWQRVFRRAA